MLGCCSSFSSEISRIAVDGMPVCLGGVVCVRKRESLMNRIHTFIGAATSQAARVDPHTPPHPNPHTTSPHKTPRTLVLGLEADLLERHDLVRHAVLGLVHHAVCPLPDLLQLLVPLHFLCVYLLCGCGFGGLGRLGGRCHIREGGQGRRAFIQIDPESLLLGKYARTLPDTSQAGLISGRLAAARVWRVWQWSGLGGCGSTWRRRRQQGRLHSPATAAARRPDTPACDACLSNGMKLREEDVGREKPIDRPNRVPNDRTSDGAARARPTRPKASKLRMSSRRDDDDESEARPLAAACSSPPPHACDCDAAAEGRMTGGRLYFFPHNRIDCATLETSHWVVSSLAFGSEALGS